MKIGILGAGNIGSTLAQRLATAEHEVTIANSRSPETVDTRALSTGARAVWARDVTDGTDVLITSIPMEHMPGLRPIVDQLNAGAVVIDTSNYWPHRVGAIDAIDKGQVESLWVSEQFERPVVKAWSAITMESFGAKALPPGHADRIAIPVAGDDPRHREIGERLVDETGFDAVNAGVLADSWRMQPGAPVYCADLPAAEVGPALAQAVASRLPLRRDLTMTVLDELAKDPTFVADGEFLRRLCRVLYA